MVTDRRKSNEARASEAILLAKLTLAIQNRCFFADINDFCGTPLVEDS